MTVVVREDNGESVLADCIACDRVVASDPRTALAHARRTGHRVRVNVLTSYDYAPRERDRVPGWSL